MQDGVFNATNIMIHGRPIVGRISIKHGVILVRASKAGIVPRGFHKGIKGVCLPFRWAARARAGGIDKGVHLFNR